MEHTKEPCVIARDCETLLHEAEAQRDKLLEALRPIAEYGEISAKIINNARAVIAEVEGKK